MRHRVLALASLLATGAAGSASAQTPPTALGYVNLTPCRLVDTRLINAPLQPGVPRTFRVKASNLANQGGSATGCGVPGTAMSAMVDFIAVNPTGSGNLKVWAYPNAEPPPSSILNYGVVAGLNAIANGIAIPICDPNSATCFFDFTLMAQGGSTHAVVDIVGYFGPAVIDDSGRAGPQGPPGLQGVQGERGIQGERGEQGIQGIQGIQGNQGIQGIQGPPGPPIGTVAVCGAGCTSCQNGWYQVSGQTAPCQAVGSGGPCSQQTFNCTGGPQCVVCAR